MNQFLLFLFLVVILVSQNGCSSLNRNLSNLFFPPNPNSDIRTGETVEINLIFDKTRKEVAQTYPKNLGVRSGAAAGPIIDLALSQLQKFFEEEAKRYSASYSAVAVSDIFYVGVANDAPINLQGIHFKRNVKGDTAMELCLQVYPTLDKTAFEIKPVSVVVRKAKAKLIAFDWFSPFGFDLLAPWTALKGDWSTLYDNDVDLRVQFTLTAVWVDEKQKGHSEVVATSEFKLQNTKLGEPIWYVDRSSPQDTDNCELIVKKELTVSKGSAPFRGQLFQAVPRSVVKIAKDQEIFGTGNFILNIIVTEYDQFGERVKELGTKIEENKSDWTKKILEAF